MQENSRYAVGIDIGTTTIRCVVGHIDPTTGTPTVVGVGSAPNSGMRKGVVANLTGPAQAIDEAGPAVAVGVAEEHEGVPAAAGAVDEVAVRVGLEHLAADPDPVEEGALRVGEIALASSAHDLLDDIAQRQRIDVAIAA